MIRELTTEIKEPRFLQAHPEDYYQVIEAVKLFWPHRIFTRLVEINLSGFVAEKCSVEHLPKIGQNLSIRLLLPNNEETQSFEVKLVRMTEKYVYFVFDKSFAKNRLLLDQNNKDKIILDSMVKIPLNLFQSAQKQSHWLHASFDTNFVLWTSEQTGQLLEFALEYDNVLLTLKDGLFDVQKTPLAVAQGQNYFPFDENLKNKGAKISLGSDWLARLIKTLQAVKLKSEIDLAELIHILKSQTRH